MALVTKTNTIRIMLNNVINYLNTNVTDPNSGIRAGYSDKWVKLADGIGKPEAPNIYVSPPVDAGSESTGNRAVIRSLRFTITIHGIDYEQTEDLADECFYQLHNHTGNAFSNDEMWRPANWLTSPEFQPHPERLGEWTANINATFQFYHTAP